MVDPRDAENAFANAPRSWPIISAPRMMPRESLRLQGFAEEQIDKILAFTSDAQAYKQAGNSVTVTVIEAIGRRILAVDEEPRKMGDAA